MKRRNSRIKAMMILYNYDINKELDFEDIDELSNEDNIEYDIDLLKELVNGVINNLEKLDYIISLNLTNYLIDRLCFVDRALIRMGTYEMLYTSTPYEIIIDEIVEISKEYSETDDMKTSRFNNSLLDKIGKFITNGKN